MNVWKKLISYMYCENRARYLTKLDINLLSYYVKYYFIELTPNTYNGIYRIELDSLH